VLRGRRRWAPGNLGLACAGRRAGGWSGGGGCAAQLPGVTRDESEASMARGGEVEAGATGQQGLVPNRC
jgi:hypothetical protein